MIDLTGYNRGERGWGLRNAVVVFPAHSVASNVAAAIARTADGVVAVRHDWHDEWDGVDGDRIRRTFTGYLSNPNVAAALVVGVRESDSWLVDEVRATGVTAGFVALSAHGGSAGTQVAGEGQLRELVDVARGCRRTPMPIGSLTVGLECGGSDGLSGITANPALGVASDLLFARGGATVLGEIAELLGAEHALARRAVNPEVSAQVFALIRDEEESIRRLGFDPRGSEPSPGNMRGGLTTIEEKSLGAAQKSGTAPVVSVVGYAEPVRARGLNIMDTPGHDVEQLVGIAAGGAQLMAFTTGRGTPTGTPIVPCLRITTNSTIFEASPGEYDIDAGTIVTGEETVAEVGQRIFDALLDVAAGRLTRTEERGNTDFAVSRTFGQVYRSTESGVSAGSTR